MKAIIIDDEPKCHDVLKKTLASNFKGIEVLGSAFSISEGHRLINKYNPDLVFLDIVLPDGQGFDLLRELDSIDFSVIFITAHDQYAYTAIKFGALDYITKPIDKDELAVAIDRAFTQVNNKVSDKQLQVLWNTIQSLREEKLPTTMSISTLEGIHYRAVEDIIRLEAHQNYTEFSFQNGKKKILASVNIGEYESQFRPYNQFMRVHRSHIVNLRQVDKYSKSDGGFLVMKNGDQLSVSRLYRDDLLRNMEKL